MDTAAGFPFLGNQQQGSTAVAHDAVPHWHAVIMLRRTDQVERVLDKSPYHSLRGGFDLYAKAYARAATRRNNWRQTVAGAAHKASNRPRPFGQYPLPVWQVDVGNRLSLMDSGYA